MHDAATNTAPPPREVGDGSSAGFEQEKPVRTLSPFMSRLLGAACALMSCFVLYQVFVPSPRGTQYYLTIFLAGVLPLVFLSYRGAVSLPTSLAHVKFLRRVGSRARRSDTPSILDWSLAVATLVVCVYPLTDFDEFLGRRQLPSDTDVVCGVVLLLLVLEACRRTTGWVLPFICALFVGYAYYGAFLPLDWSISHEGFYLSEIIGNVFVGTGGFYGTPLNVAATYIVLFTIYGAVLKNSGAGKFFIDISFAAFKGSRTAPGRTVTLSGFLLGSVSGSGTATAVSLGSVAWPILREASYPREKAGGMLAAAGIGAILSPPTMGAAAFIIAEYLRTSYFTVVVYALIPTLLYYLGIILAIEIDARRHGTRSVQPSNASALRLLLRFGYHFLSLFVIIGFLAMDVPPFRAVVYATLLQLVLSFLDRRHRLTPHRLVLALAEGTRSTLPVVATCAAAGIIVAVVTLTGLGLNLAGIIVDWGHIFGENQTVVLVLTAVFSAAAVTLLGLAVPVTASFIIASVVIAPALLGLGVPAFAAYMFVFYYAVLSEVSPPTALAAVAAAAITEGSPTRTMMATLKYALPAFLVPLAFVLTENGQALLLEGPLWTVVWVTASAAVAVAALAGCAGGWLLRPAGLVERVLSGIAACLLLFLHPATVVTGLILLGLAVAVNIAVRPRAQQLTEGTHP